MKMELYSTLSFYNIVFAVEQETLNSRKCFESAKWRAQRAHMPYVPKYILQNGKLKN